MAPSVDMKPVIRHRWDLTPRQAVALQHELAGRLVRRNAPLRPGGRVRLAAGADVSYSRRTNTCYAAVVVFSLPEWSVVEECVQVRRATFPYVPGLLSFREGPAVAAALERLQAEPDVLVFDGQGLAHPRGFGLACHIGLLFDVPSIGCAKSRLFGDEAPLDLKRGAVAPLRHPATGRRVGMLLRSRAGVRPLYISPGHRFSVAGALNFMRRCPGPYRLPEIVRRPHVLSNAARAAHEPQ
ncbi:MAG: deoxyribonuclease V [Candidatus Sumerlaeia bacterium]